MNAATKAPVASQNGKPWPTSTTEYSSMAANTRPIRPKPSPAGRGPVGRRAPRLIARSASAMPSRNTAAPSRPGTRPGTSYLLMCRFSSRSMRQEPMATAPPNAIHSKAETRSALGGISPSGAVSMLTDQGLAMPTVSGATLVLPVECSSQALAWIAGMAAACAASPATGANSAPLFTA